MNIAPAKAVGESELHLADVMAVLQRLCCGDRCFDPTGCIKRNGEADVRRVMSAVAQLRAVNRDAMFDEVVKASRRVLAHLQARIEAAPLTSVPVFDGIADLHDALNRLDSIAKATDTKQGMGGGE